MSENNFFEKLCWVCLAEESNMQSLIDKDKKIEFENIKDSVSLYDLLSYVISTNIFYVDGPHLICNNCKIQACAAYKFKKRCDVSSNIFQQCGLIPCNDDKYCTTNKLDHVKVTEEPTEDIKLSEEAECVKQEVIKIEDDLVINEDIIFEDDTVFEIVQDDLILINDEESMRNLIHNQVRSQKTDKLLCAVCGLIKSRSNLKQHMLRHADVKNHICPFCQRKFNDKGNLKVHIRIHTGIHPFKCDICNKSFIQSTSLKIHKRVHDGVKPYKCYLCPYSCRTSSHLQLHIKRHKGVKNYHCNNCDYSACSKAELRYHLAKHSNNKCFVCGLCGKSFARYKGLKTHEKSHTGERPHICEVCGKGFTQAHSLRSHLRNIHKPTTTNSVSDT